MFDDDETFEHRTYLYVRDHSTDDGTEPLPAGLPAWLSPDIVVIRPDGTRGGEAVVGAQNRVEVTVTNRGGIDAVDAYVDVFFANSATAWTPATAAPVGGGYLTIPGYSTQAIAFLWSPPASYQGHGCLLARVDLPLYGDAIRDRTVFDVVGDRHVAQRNIEVVTLDPSSNVTEFAFNIVNPSTEELEARVFTAEVRDPDQLEHVRASLGCDFAQFGETPLENFGLVVEGEPVQEFVVQLGPEEVRETMLYAERNPGTRPGDLHAIQITQLDGRDQLLGGLTVVVRH